jgi:xylose dehydrogenase (NAD/NADP)
VGCYCVSGMRNLLGEPASVSGRQVTGASGVDVVMAGTLIFPRDIIGQFDSGLCLPSRDELEVIGEDGSLWLDDPWLCNEPGIELRRADRSEPIPIAKANPYQLEMDNLSDSIRGNATPLLGRDDALGQARVIEALYRSAEVLQPVAPADL